jgi:hypothetical protein
MGSFAHNVVNASLLPGKYVVCEASRTHMRRDKGMEGGPVHSHTSGTRHVPSNTTCKYNISKTASATTHAPILCPALDSLLAELMCAGAKHAQSWLHGMVLPSMHGVMPSRSCSQSAMCVLADCCHQARRDYARAQFNPPTRPSPTCGGCNDRCKHSPPAHARQHWVDTAPGHELPCGSARRLYMRRRGQFGQL